jgi:hypothetical protein
VLPDWQQAQPTRRQVLQLCRMRPAQRPVLLCHPILSPLPQRQTRHPALQARLPAPHRENR